MYWVGPPGAAQDAGEGTDFYAVSNNYVSVTPLQIDLTRYDSLAELDNWLSANSGNVPSLSAHSNNDKVLDDK